MILRVVYLRVSYMIYASRLILKVKVFQPFYSILRSACPMETHLRRSFVFYSKWNNFNMKSLTKLRFCMWKLTTILIDKNIYLNSQFQYLSNV